MGKKKEADWKRIAFVLANRLRWILSSRATMGLGLLVDLDTGESQHWRDAVADDLELMPGWKIDREACKAMEWPKRERDAFFAKRRRESQSK